MALRLRPLDPSREADELISVLERNLTDLDHRARFRWLYLDNPAGPARSWILEDTQLRRPVGAASAFPRLLWVGGQLRTGLQVGDFSVDPSHRTLGPALLLQRATLEPVQNRTFALCYDCPPHLKGLAPLLRLGLKPQFAVRRYARPLRADFWILRQPLLRGFHAVLAPPANLLLSAPFHSERRLGSLHLDVFDRRFDDEFSAIDRSLAETGVLRTAKTAALLNWRYRDDPLNHYIVLTARLSGCLVGYAILRRAHDSMEFIDLLCRRDSGVSGELLNAAAELARRERMTALSFVVGDQTRFASVLRSHWFLRREQVAHVTLYARPSSEEASIVHSSSWWFFHADLLA